MIWALFFLFLLRLLTDFAHADQIGCPGDVEVAVLEERHNQPYPILLPPDVVENDNTPQRRLEWHYLNTVPEDDNTVHCYPKKHSDEKIDVLLPKGITQCTLYKKHFWCE